MAAVDPALLAAVEQAAHALAQQRYGDATRPSRLSQAIQTASQSYTRERLPDGRADSARLSLAARLLFFTLADLPKLVVALEELISIGRIAVAGDPARTDKPLRILDLGAGLGAQTLGVLLALDRPGLARALSLQAVDRDAAALDLLQQLVDRCRASTGLGQGTSLTTVVHDLSRTDPLAALDINGELDLIVAGNLLNELPGPRREPLLRGLLGSLAPAGHLIVIEPALRQTTRDLHRLRDAVLADGTWTVLAPCTRQGPCPALEQPGEWCHERRPWDPPPRFRALARAAGLRRSHIKWSYLSLCHGPAPSGDAWRVVSDPLGSKGKLELFLCGAAGRLRAVRLNRHRSPANHAFQRVRRGDVIGLQNAVLEGGLLRVTAGTGVRLQEATGS